MPELFDPILIRYDGLDAENHEIDLALLGESLKGGSRLLGIAAHLVLKGEYVSRSPAMSVKVLASIPQAKCFEIPVHLLYSIPILPLLSQTGRDLAKKAIESIVNFMLAKMSGKTSEAQAAMDVAMAAIEANKDVTLASLDFARQAIERAADDQRPAARSFAAPVGPSVRSAMIGDRKTAFLVNEEARDIIDRPDPVEIGPAQSFTVSISELDIKTGACKVALHGDNSDRYVSEITDPVVQNPHNPYSAALDLQSWVKVIAKPHLRDGKITKLTISDTQP